MNSKTYEALDKHWKKTCEILLGSECGELANFEGYLSEMVQQPAHHKSAVSGKDVYSSRAYYCKGANFARNDEITYNKQFKLNLNEIKDLDGLISALGPQVQYVGDKNLGISSNLERADSCTDSNNVLNSHQILTSENVAHSYSIREGKSVFGCVWSGEISFMVRCHATFKSSRCFETYLAMNSSDLSFSFNCRSCSETLFAFNQISKRYLIGNLELPKDKYLTLKKKLLGEIASVLKGRKKHISLFELVGGVRE